MRTVASAVTSDVAPFAGESKTFSPPSPGAVPAQSGRIGRPHPHPAHNTASGEARRISSRRSVSCGLHDVRSRRRFRGRRRARHRGADAEGIANGGHARSTTRQDHVPVTGGQALKTQPDLVFYLNGYARKSPYCCANLFRQATPDDGSASSTSHQAKCWVVPEGSARRA